MSSFASHQEAAKAAALAIVKDGPETVSKLEAAFQQHFAPVDSVTTEFTKSETIENEQLNAAVGVAIDTAASTLSALTTVEQYVTLTIPKMEDGNNFGVTVQLAALKSIGDAQEKITKQMDEVGKYFSARADALEKCKLATTSTTKSTTVSDSKGQETGKEGAQNKESSSTSTEQKTTESSSSVPEAPLRIKAVQMVDVLYYTKAKALLQTAIGSYAAALDFVEKNSEKIEAPKGSRGSGTAYHSMY